MFSRWLMAVFLIVNSGAAVFAAGARAQDIDPHQLYERHCGGCHAAHARDFVRKSLERRGGDIVGRNSGVALGTFMARGHGRLDAFQAREMVAHLTAIFDGGWLFQERCRICHDRAVLFARRSLVLRDGRVVGRYTGRDIRSFLDNHGRIDAGEAETIMVMLKRQLATGE
jgi:cytochrome c5